MERGGILAGWNPWHECHQISEGCRHCYVFRMDGRYGRLPDTVRKNREFDLPIQKNRNGAYKIPSGEVVYTCFTSDFFLEDADPWRADAWQMIARRQDLHFFMITKRIHRFEQCVPSDWGTGYRTSRSAVRLKIKIGLIFVCRFTVICRFGINNWFVPRF